METQPPEYDEEECDDGILPTDHNQLTITTPEQDQGVRDLARFFAEARPF